jgi:hypothetical protein
MPIKPGTRLRCERCGTETILIAGDPELVCCDQPMTVTFTPDDGSAVEDDHSS